ncbi:MAG: peptidyl-prolyl cis-trans isomerase [Nitrospirae bacterium]|nr:peptidyl-prolyl cis-trans isomerase [Nitrospirota bacterium]
MIRFLMLILALLFVVSCSKGGDQKGEYIAKINDTVITKEDIKTEMSYLPPELAAEFFGGSDGATRLVDEIVQKEIFYWEAKKRGLDKTKDFEKKIETLKKNTLIKQLLDEEMKTAAKVTEKEAKEYYDKNKDDFIRRNQVRLSQIVVKSESDAQKVYERLQKGEDFAKIASSMSIEKASAKAGGDIGIVKKGELRKEIEAVAFRLKKGQVGAPVKLNNGIHIFKLTDVKGTPEDFEKIKEIIIQGLSREKEQDHFEKFRENLKKSYKIEINKEAIAKMMSGDSGKQQTKEQKQEKAK